MSKIKIATDSTADIPKSFCEELNISVLPLTILAGEKEYRDGVDITPSEFYQIIDASKTLPVSSQVASVLYSDLFEETWKAGYTDLIQVTLNSKGSGTYQAAVLSRNLFYEEHQEAKEQLAKAEASVQEVIDHIEEWLAHSRPVFVTLDLRCVKKSGRISPAAAFVGDAVGLKPIITFENGDAKIIGKARGERKAISALVERCMKERRPCFLSCLPSFRVLTKRLFLCIRKGHRQSGALPKAVYIVDPSVIGLSTIAISYAGRMIRS